MTELYLGLMFIGIVSIGIGWSMMRAERRQQADD